MMGRSLVRWRSSGETGKVRGRSGEVGSEGLVPGDAGGGPPASLGSGNGYP